VATSVKLSDDLKARISKLSEQRKHSAYWIMREAILQYVDREEARESFKQEAEASLAEFQATGMHLTGDETRAWLGFWGTGAENAAPRLIVTTRASRGIDRCWRFGAGELPPKFYRPSMIQTRPDIVPNRRPATRR
jgi:predicted transcriptional regulator